MIVQKKKIGSDSLTSEFHSQSTNMVSPIKIKQI